MNHYEDISYLQANLEYPLAEPVNLLSWTALQDSWKLHSEKLVKLERFIHCVCKNRNFEFFRCWFIFKEQTHYTTIWENAECDTAKIQLSTKNGRTASETQQNAISNKNKRRYGVCDTAKTQLSIKHGWAASETQQNTISNKNKSTECVTQQKLNYQYNMGERRVRHSKNTIRIPSVTSPKWVGVNIRRLNAEGHTLNKFKIFFVLIWTAKIRSIRHPVIYSILITYHQ